MDNKKTYEGMFLMDAGNPDFEAATEPIRTVLARSEAEILAIKPWDERRLAYEIQGRKRGLYVLTYFSVDPLKMREIEHDCNLDERIIRSLFLRLEKVTPELLAAQTPATGLKVETEEVPMGEGDRGDRRDRDRGDRGDRGERRDDSSRT